jgi:hypothetical protein
LAFVVEAFSLEAVRFTPAATLPAPRFACSTIPCSEADMALVAEFVAVLSGEAGFSGEAGREIWNGLVGEYAAGLTGLIGERERVRELWDLGESTLPGPFLAARDAVREFGALALVRLRFLGLESGSGWTTGSFSLSERMAISESSCFVPFRRMGRAGTWSFAAAADVVSEAIVKLLISGAGSLGSALPVLGKCGISLAIEASM